MTTQQKVERAISEAKKFPNAKIEYNLEGITDKDFKGVPATFNPKVDKEAGAVVTFKY